MVLLLALAAWTIPTRRADVPRLVWVALGLLSAFTAWTYLSILWADDQGIAWEGANRTLLFLAVFALFALWRQRPATAATLLGVYTLGVAVVGLVLVLRLATADAGEDLFFLQRLVEPAGYANASAAALLMAVWPALSLASAKAVPWWLRGVFAGAAVLLLDLALMTQSRGAAIATPVTALLWLALFPDRVRRGLTAVPVVIAAALAAPALTDVNDVFAANTDPTGALDDAQSAALMGALLAGAAVAGAAMIDARRVVSEELRQRAHRAIATAALAIAGLGLVAGAITLGSPTERASDAWDDFKGGYAEATFAGGGGRAFSGLGSNRYDFYRVSLDLFADHPLNGVGIDNFRQDYLQRGRSDEVPSHPHSILFKMLAQTGLIGTLLLAAFFAVAAVPVARALRRGDPLVAAVAGGAAGVTIYWLIHGFADWLYEYPALGAAAFAMLGLACALAPRPGSPYRGFPALISGRVPSIGAAVALLALVVVVALPYLSQREVRDASRSWTSEPREALDTLERARKLDPLDDDADLTRGAILVRLNDLRGADAAFADALERNPRNDYAALERGAIAATLGDRVAAERWLEEAVRRAPTNAVAIDALEKVRAGRPVDVRKTNLALQRQATRFVR
jgi:O-antigen ligase